MRSFLDTYCGPGRHNFLLVSPRGLAWCSNCFKEQPPGHAVCLVCDSHSVEEVHLVDVTAPGTTVEGGLCAACLQAFSHEGQVGLWRLRGGDHEGRRTE